MGKMPRNAEYTKIYNRNMILRRLRYAPLSRAELARASGLTRANVSLIAEELLSQGIVTELDPVAAGRGRTRRPLMIRRGVYCAAGIYLNRDGCRIGTVDLDGTILAAQQLELSGGFGLRQLCDALGRILEDPQISGYQVLGIGVSAPGPLDSEEGRILNPPKFSKWHNIGIKAELERAFGLPVYLENNACTLAQYYAEQKGLSDLLLLIVDSGIGSGVMLGGKLFRSAGGFTSELGHTTISFQGTRCSCGRRGCLEAYAAVPNLLRGTPYQTWNQLIDAERADARQARHLLEREAGYLAAGIANFVNIINIGKVLLAGDIYYGFDLLKPMLERRLEGMLLRDKSLEISAVELRREVQLSAAGCTVFSHFLASPH